MKLTFFCDILQHFDLFIYMDAKISPPVIY